MSVTSPTLIFLPPPLVVVPEVVPPLDFDLPPQPASASATGTSVATVTSLERRSVFRGVPSWISLRGARAWAA